MIGPSPRARARHRPGNGDAPSDSIEIGRVCGGVSASHDSWNRCTGARGKKQLFCYTWGRVWTTYTTPSRTHPSMSCGESNARSTATPARAMAESVSFWTRRSQTRASEA